MKKKSAKDIDFERERAKYRSRIRELENCLDIRQEQINELNSELREKEQFINQQNDWIERLLEYTELSKEDLQKLISDERTNAKIRERLHSTFNAIDLMAGRGAYSRN